MSGAPPRLDAPLNRVSPALRLGISTRAATRIGLTGASTLRRPARSCFAGFTAGDFNPHRSLRGASTLRRPAQPCFAGFTAGDFNPLGHCGAPPRLGAPLNRVSPALRLGISTRAATRIGLTGASTLRRPARSCFAGFTAGDFNPLGLCGAPPRLGAPMNRVSPALRLGISTRAATRIGLTGETPRGVTLPDRFSPALRLGISTRIGLTGASTLRRPAPPCFAGSTAGDFNPRGPCFSVTYSCSLPPTGRVFR